MQRRPDPRGAQTKAASVAGVANSSQTDEASVGAGGDFTGQLKPAWRSPEPRPQCTTVHLPSPSAQPCVVSISISSMLAFNERST